MSNKPACERDKTMKKSLVVFLGSLCTFTALSIYIGNSRPYLSSFTDELMSIRKTISGGIGTMPPPVAPGWKR